MKKLIPLLVCCFVLSSILLSGCGSFFKGTQNNTNKPSVTDADSTVTDETPKPLPIPNVGDSVPVGESFNDPFAHGSLTYTVRKSANYKSLSECNLTRENFLDPHNLYPDYAIGEKYRSVSDYIDENGNIVDSHQLVVLDININNIDALGEPKKKEFNINNLSLLGGEPVTHYNIAYFSEAGKIQGSTQPLHYELAQGQEINIKLGFFVLKEDLEANHIVGVAGLDSENKVTFNIGVGNGG